MLSWWLWMTVIAAGVSAAPFALAQPVPPRRPPIERVEPSRKQPPADTPEAHKTEPKPEAHKPETPKPEAPQTKKPTEGVECLANLHAEGWDAEPAKPQAQKSECSVPEPVAVTRFRVRDQVVEFPDRPILACRFAGRLG